MQKIVNKHVHVIRLKTNRWRATYWDRENRSNKYIGTYPTYEEACTAQDAKQTEANGGVPFKRKQNPVFDRAETSLSTLILPSGHKCRGCGKIHAVLEQPRQCKCGAIFFDNL